MTVDREVDERDQSERGHDRHETRRSERPHRGNLENLSQWWTIGATPRINALDVLAVRLDRIAVVGPRACRLHGCAIADADDCKADEHRCNNVLPVRTKPGYGGKERRRESDQKVLHADSDREPEEHRACQIGASARPAAQKREDRRKAQSERRHVAERRPAIDCDVRHGAEQECSGERDAERDPISRATRNASGKTAIAEMTVMSWSA